jgi:phage gp36-like protein
VSYSDETIFQALGLPAAALDGVTDTSDWRDAAAGRIDSHLRGRYLLPLDAPYPAEVVDCECAIAAYLFLSNRGFDPEAGANQNIMLRYKDAMTWLRDLAAGKVNLAVTADATDSTHEGGPVVASRARDSSAVFRDSDDCW